MHPSGLRRTIALIAFIASILPVLVSVQAADSSFLSQKEQAWLHNLPQPLRIHNEMEWKPYNYNENGQAKGIQSTTWT